MVKISCNMVPSMARFTMLSNLSTALSMCVQLYLSAGVLLCRVFSLAPFEVLRTCVLRCLCD